MVAKSVPKNVPSCWISLVPLNNVHWVFPHFLNKATHTFVPEIYTHYLLVPKCAKDLSLSELVLIQWHYYNNATFTDVHSNTLSWGRRVDERGGIMHNADVVSENVYQLTRVSVGKRARTSLLITICCLHPKPCRLQNLRHKEMTWQQILDEGCLGWKSNSASSISYVRWSKFPKPSVFSSEDINILTWWDYYEDSMWS